MPIKRKRQYITQQYKGEAHRGVDLRSVDFSTWKLQPVIATEDSIIDRIGIDGYGNDFIVLRPRRLETNMELKYIHVSYDPEYIKTGETLNRGDVIGQTQTVKTVGSKFFSKSAGKLFGFIFVFVFVIELRAID